MGTLLASLQTESTKGTALSDSSGPWGTTEGALRAWEHIIDSPQTKPYWNEYTPDMPIEYLYETRHES